MPNSSKPSRTPRTNATPNSQNGSATTSTSTPTRPNGSPRKSMPLQKNGRGSPLASAPDGPDPRPSPEGYLLLTPGRAKGLVAFKCEHPVVPDEAQPLFLARILDAAHVACPGVSSRQSGVRPAESAIESA